MINHDSEAAKRLETMLTSALGADIANYLIDRDIVEIFVNPDGKLWIDRLGVGREFTGVMLPAKNVERAIYIIASSIGEVCNRESPFISAELSYGARFQGVLPPLSTNPCFSVRRKASRIYSVDDYVKQGSLSLLHANYFRGIVKARKNIVIAGGTGSGKTTLANAILALIAETGDRLILIEDTLELQCNADDFVSLRAREQVTIKDLVRITMRLRPDRIIIGEVRGGEALDLLKAWNTGHPGGIATIHADSADKALTRFEQLVLEVGVVDARQLIAESVNVIVFIERVGVSRKIREIVEVGWGGNRDYSIRNVPAE